MDIRVNSDGSTVVTCGNESVTINPPPPGSSSNPGSTGGSGAGTIPYPNTTAAIISREDLGDLDSIFQGSLPPRRHFATEEANIHRSVVLHATGNVDISAVRKALENAGYGNLQIEIVPLKHNG